jgi:hypothetical protein
LFYSPQGDYRHLKADCPNLTNEDPANVEEGPSQLPDCPLCLLMGQQQILPKALSAFREALGKPRREVEVSCYFFGFDHPTKLAFRLDQDGGQTSPAATPIFLPHALRRNSPVARNEQNFRRRPKFSRRSRRGICLCRTQSRQHAGRGVRSSL